MARIAIFLMIVCLMAGLVVGIFQYPVIFFTGLLLFEVATLIGMFLFVAWIVADWLTED